MERIIIPTDFGAKAFKIIEAGILLAKRMKVSAEIIHVIDSFEYGVNFVINESNPIILPPNVLNDKVGKAQGYFQDTMSKLRAKYKELPEIFLSVKTGFVFDVISEVLNDPEVVMVILSDKSQADYNYREISKNFSEIITKTNCPVCVIPNEAPFNDPKNIIYASNYHEQDITNILNIVKIAKSVDAFVHIVHVTSEKTFKESLAMRGLEAKIKSRTPYESLIFKLLISKDIIQGLDDYANIVDADRIAILRGNKTMFQGIFGTNKTRDIVYKTNLPVIIYQEKNCHK